MVRINYRSDANAENTGQGGNAQFSPAPRGVYTLQIADFSDGEVTQGGKNPGTPITKLTCEIADEGEHFGKRVWHNVVWVPRGNGEKANPGHGMAVHFLHAVGLQYDGEFSFEESDLQGRTFRALLGVAAYDKVVNGRTYSNEKNFVEELFTDQHPEPASDELPPPRRPRSAGAAKSAAKPNAEAHQPESDEVPF